MVLPKSLHGPAEPLKEASGLDHLPTHFSVSHARAGWRHRCLLSLSNAWKSSGIKRLPVFSDEDDAVLCCASVSLGGLSTDTVMTLREER